MTEVPDLSQDTAEQRTITFSTRKQMAVASLVAYILGATVVLGMAVAIPGVAERLAKIETLVIFLFGGVGSIVGAYFGSTLIINGMFKR